MCDSEHREAGPTSSPHEPSRLKMPKAYRLYVVTRMMATVGITSINMVVGWILYDISGNPIYLGIAGLVLFAPSLLLILVTGMVSDRFERRSILCICYIAMATCALGLLVLERTDSLKPYPILLMVLIMGTARAFYLPTVKALLVDIVGGRDLPQAIALNSSLTKIAVVSGPITAGLLFSLSPSLPMVVAFLVFFSSSITAPLLKGKIQKRPAGRVTGNDLIAGFQVIRRDPTLLAVVSLDFCVMFISGATALLPIFAKDVLATDATGLGFLRAAPAVGAFAVAALLSQRPIRHNAGILMLISVAGYGATMLIFGFSTQYWLSYIALFLGGGLDMLGANIRESLVQLRTPDFLRGRVNAVTSVVVGASNELGDFRAGAFAAVVGAAPTVLFGGVTALCVAGIWTRIFPHLSKIDRLE